MRQRHLLGPGEQRLHQVRRRHVVEQERLKLYRVCRGEVIGYRSNRVRGLRTREVFRERGRELRELVSS